MSETDQCQKSIRKIRSSIRRAGSLTVLTWIQNLTKIISREDMLGLNTASAKLDWNEIKIKFTQNWMIGESAIQDHAIGTVVCHFLVLRTFSTL